MELLGLRFADPAWLLALLVPGLLLFLARRREREGSAVLYPGAGQIPKQQAGARARLRHLPLAAALMALTLGVVALARPQKGFLKETETTQGVDIVVALDVSGSMAAEDFQPRNRLEVARKVVADFVERRRRDRIGLVVFAGQSLTKAPPTTDAAVLLKQLDDVKLGMLPDGTAIGSGLATSLTRLRRSTAKSRVVVLVTDGSNNAGEIDPSTATDLARAMEVRVYTVLVGRGGEVPMPVRLKDPSTGVVYEERHMVEVQIDPDLLKTIAHGGRVLPGHRLRRAAADLRAHRPARDVGDQAGGVPSLRGAVPAVPLRVGRLAPRGGPPPRGRPARGPGVSEAA